MSVTEFIPGFYEHYKGRKYHALRIAYMEGSLEPYVIYEDSSGKLFSRAFNTPGKPSWTDTVEIEGESVPRFKLIERDEEKNPVPIKDVFCNRCGGSCCCYPGQNYGLQNAKVSGGYFSEDLNDCTSYTFSLCEKCLREIFATFKIPPAVRSMYGNPTYEMDLQDHDQYLWNKDKKAKLEKESRGLCSEHRNCQNSATQIHLISGEPTEKVCDDCAKTCGYSNSSFQPIGADHA